MAKVNLLANAVKSRSLAASAQSLINLYPEIETDVQETRITLYGVAGKRLLCNVGDYQCRGMIAVNGFIYAVTNNKVYKIATDGTSTLLGTINSTIGQVSMSYNGIAGLIVDGVNGYVVTTTSVTQITDTDFPNGVTWCDYLDGFFLMGGNGTQNIYGSNLLDGANYDALNFQVADGMPDNVVKGIVSSSELLAFGTDTLQFLVNTGAAGFPFEWSGNAFVEHGCIARESVVKLDSSVFWLGNSKQGDGIVWRLNGYTPVRVSTHAIEYAISKWPDKSDTTAYSYVDGGHSFYVITSLSGNQTFVYDAATQMWHQRAAFIDGAMSRDKGQYHCFVSGLHIVGDKDNGNIYILDDEIYDDYQSVLLREITTSHLHSDSKRAFYSQFELYMETGVGLLSGQGSDPQVEIAMSNDLGRTFGVPRYYPIGALGDYRNTVQMNQCGSALTAKTFRIRITAPVKVVFTGARVEVTK